MLKNDKKRDNFGMSNESSVVIGNELDSMSGI